MGKKGSKPPTYGEVLNRIIKDADQNFDKINKMMDYTMNHLGKGHFSRASVTSAKAASTAEILSVNLGQIAQIIRAVEFEDKRSKFKLIKGSK
jgi:hypothetical protein